MGKAKGKKAPKKTAKKSPVKKTIKKTKASAKKIAKPVKKKSATALKSAKAPASRKATPVVRITDWQNFVTPLDDRLIVELESAERRTPGGLIIPDTSLVRGQFRGTVLVVGRGHRNQKGYLRPMDVKAGDKVVFEEHAGSKINLNGADVRILRESEVLAIVEK